MSEEELEEIRIISETYPDGIHKKSQADEMFENIDGYKLVKHYENDEIITYQLVENYYYEEYIHHLKGTYLEIIFDKTHNYLNIVQEDCSNYRTVTSIINMNIYKAINEKIKELGWLDDN